MVRVRTPLARAIWESGRRQVELAQRVGLHDSQLSRIVHGFRPASPEERKALARELRKPVAVLFPPPETDPETAEAGV
jgi:transcriptional regulator with XRE-family HTH domain